MNHWTEDRDLLPEKKQRLAVNAFLHVTGLSIATLVFPMASVWGQQAVTAEALGTMQTKGRDLILVDVRSPADFQASHIQGAINIPRPMILKAQFSHAKSIVLYCSNAKCPLSYSAAKELVGSGYDKVRVLEGGLDGWQSKSYQIATAPAATMSNALQVERISPRELNGKLGKRPFIVLDVRLPAEYRAGHIPGAVNIALEDLTSKSFGLDQTKLAVIYDRRSHRSKQAAQRLQAGGFKVLELSGGISVWAAMKFPIEAEKHL